MYNTNIFILIDISNFIQILHSYCTNILLLLTIHNIGGWLFTKLLKLKRRKSLSNASILSLNQGYNRILLPNS